MARSLAALAPLPALFVALALLLRLEASLPMLGVGAGGWCLALAIRVPAIFALGRMGRAAVGVWLSGPAEELVRLAMVLGFAHSADEAYWLGLGWGLAEVPYHVLESAVLWRLQQGAPAQGQASLVDAAVAELAASPWSWWRSLERYSATALHVGFTLAMELSAWAALVLVPAHSLLNQAFLWGAGRSVAAAEWTALAVGLAALAAGLALAL